MGEPAVIKRIRGRIEETVVLLDDESFNVATTRGKFSQVFDITCKDKGCDKLVKVCEDTISQKELDDILNFNDVQLSTGTILQIFFWKKNAQRPFARPKLFYNQPDQRIPDDLQNLVK